MDVHIVTGDMHARAHSPVASPRLNGRLVEWEGEGVNYAMIRIYVNMWHYGWQQIVLFLSVVFCILFAL